MLGGLERDAKEEDEFSNQEDFDDEDKEECRLRPFLVNIAGAVAE